MVHKPHGRMTLRSLGAGQKIESLLKPLILFSAGTARAKQNQGFSEFCPVLSCDLPIRQAIRDVQKNLADCLYSLEGVC